MNLQTFRAPTMAECLGEVKRVMGPEAVILHTRTLTIKRFLGLRRRDIVEITAGRGLINGGPRGPRRVPARPHVEMNVSGGQSTGVAIALPPPQAQPGPRIDSQSGVDPAVIRDLMGQVRELKGMVGDIQRRAVHNEMPDIPVELAEEFALLVENQVERQLAEEICKTIHRTLRPDHLAQKQFVRDKIAEQIEKLLPVSGPIVRTVATGPHVVALIGPTGVGKTTTIAKLAAKLKLDENRRVGLITIDTYRIAAVDQLKKYADIIGSPLKVVASPDDLREAVASMRECDFVLIDTAGRSPKDTLKLNELKQFLDAANPQEVHLVLSSVVDRQSIDLAIERFRAVRLDKLIFTKLDESKHV
ncbi:MAG: flagellar biosynthesis protein FlhF, partial [Tepidisphaeraceae bacterium]